MFYLQSEIQRRRRTRVVKSDIPLISTLFISIERKVREDEER
jgi:hypothetical protein